MRTTKLIPLFFIIVLMSTLAACATSRASLAVQGEQITLQKTEADVIAAAGPPELILAHDGAETFYYQDGDRAVSVTLVDKVVAAFQDSDTWPAAAMEAAQNADKPVSTGVIRLGLSEVALRAAMGDPDGVTAKDGVETFHWLTGDDVDSAVDLKGGVVVGFWDRPITEFTQDLPTHERDESTTSGALRVGMTPAQVKERLGEPDGKSGAEGLVTHRYESDPLFGDTIHYTVGYKDGVVVALAQVNVSKDEELKEQQEEARQAAAVAARQKEIGTRMLNILSNPLVQQALLSSMSQRPRTISQTTTQSTEDRTLEINGTQYKGGANLGQPCSLDSPCPAGYTCHLIGDTSGMCVQ
jgi:hypothetical protein